MRIAFCSDVHVANHKQNGGAVVSGLNERCQDTISVLRQAVLKAITENCDALVIAGDLFDSAKPEPQIIAEVQRSFVGTSLSIYVMKGNHDETSSAPGDHALGPLAPLGPAVRVIEQPVLAQALSDGDLILVPFRSGLASTWLSEAISSTAEVQRTDRTKSGRRPASRPRALALHLGLTDDRMAPWLRESSGAVLASLVQSLCKEHNIVFAASGDFHEYKLWSEKPWVVQIGALCPTGWRDQGYEQYGSLCIWDSKAKSYERHVIPGPRFLFNPRAHDLVVAKRAGHKIYVRYTASNMDEKLALKERLEADLKSGRVHFGSVEIDQTSTIVAARSAAMAAKSSKTRDDALDAFVRNMPLEDGVDRADVLERSKSYLEK
jgi:DNA repair exonuclease SbcCD nuclease subunit